MIKKPIEQYTPDELEAVDVKMAEQETTFTAYRDEDFFSVWVTDNTMLTKMKKLMGAVPAKCKLKHISYTKEGKPACYSFRMSKRCLSLRGAVNLSDEERAAKSERARQMYVRRMVARMHRSLGR